MTEGHVRPDPLQVALTAIGDYDRAMNEQYSDVAPGADMLYWRAELRVLFALAEEVRKLRVEMAQSARIGTAWLKEISAQIDEMTGGDDGTPSDA